MKFAVIGAGNVGSQIARAVVGVGHEVVLTEDAEGADALAEELDAPLVSSNGEAARLADAVVLAIPFGTVDEVAPDLAAAADGKIVIDVTNPLKEDYSGLVTETGPSGAERVQQLIPSARIVKAFNTVFAANQATAEVDGVQLDGFVAGDDDDAKREVMNLLAQIGFRPIDAGPLSSARYLEAMGYLNIALNTANDWPWQTGWKMVGPTA